MAGTELALQLIPDHNERARRRLPFQWWHQPRIAGVARGLGATAQVLETLIFRTLDERTFNTSAGIHLERWGDLVGERRGALADTDYRRFIRARMRANRWNKFGTVAGIDELLAIYGLVMDAQAVRYFPMYHAGYALVAQTGTFIADEVAQRVVRLMLDCQPAGIEMSLVEALPGSLVMSGGPGMGLGTLARTLYP